MFKHRHRMVLCSYIALWVVWMILTTKLVIDPQSRFVEPDRDTLRIFGDGTYELGSFVDGPALVKNDRNGGGEFVLEQVSQWHRTFQFIVARNALGRVALIDLIKKQHVNYPDLNHAPIQVWLIWIAAMLLEWTICCSGLALLVVPFFSGWTTLGHDH